jgi:VWFA-related protein
MTRRVFPRVIAGLLLLASASSQQNPDNTIRITVNLVQVDAVVTDSGGRHVGGLEARDFEILQDGKPQRITHFSYVSTVPPKPATPVPPSTVADKKSPPPPAIPPARIRMNQVRRTIALVVDDLGLSFESIAQVRSSLRKFVDQQMEPGDLVAIIRTGAGMGALQSFTTNKAELNAAIERVKFNSFGRVGLSSFAPLGSAESEDERSSAMEFRSSAFTVGTMGAIRFIADGLKELPGRKSVIVFSENMRMFNSEGADTWVMDSMRRLTDLCNRASVVLYTIDPRGLPTLSLTAADRPGDVGRPDRIAEQHRNRHQKYWESQEGMSFLAQETGGMFIRDTNDISKGLAEVMNDQAGYYLIGYTPDSSTFDEKSGRRKFHKIKINVLRPGLSVRTRNGFLGVPDQYARSAPRTRDEQLQHALVSPFGSTGIHLRLTGWFSHVDVTDSRTKKKRPASFVTSMLHIDGHDLTWVDEPEKKNDKGEIENDWHKTVVDVVAITFGDNGAEVDRSNRTFTIRVRGQEYRKAVTNGFVYRLNHPVKKPGAYQLRTAVRDANSEKVGSASQFIEVPDVGKGRLTLSGVVLRANPGQTVAASEGHEQGDPNENPAVRIFKPGRSLIYGYQILNAQLDRATKKPQMQAQLRLFRDGRQIYTGKPMTLETGDQPDLNHILAGGRLQLGSKMAPGDYVLQVVVTDNLAKEKWRVATSAMDFEVRN